MKSRFSSLASRFAPLALVGSSLLACSSSGAPAPETIGHEGSAVIKGTNSDASQNAVVLVIHYDPTSQDVAACSGTLIAENLVLTARHCVADTDESAACDDTGAPLAGGVVHANFTASTMYVFVGATRPDFNSPTITPDGVGAQILDDGGTNLCNHDVALIVLSKPISGAKLMPLRLDGTVTAGELVTAVGWGVTDTTEEPTTRQQRSGIAIELVGPADGTDMAVAPNEFEVGESICSGDSGGPAIADTGAEVGVVSRGGNDTTPDPSNPSSSCIGAENLYSRVSAFKDFIMTGFATVGAQPWIEGGPDPRLAVAGTACTDDTDCQSNLCVADPSQAGALTCATDCSMTACPDDGTTCVTEGANMVCRAPGAGSSSSGTTEVVHKSGCAAAPIGASSNGMLGGCLLGLALVCAARRRRSTSR